MQKKKKKKKKSHFIKSYKRLFCRCFICLCAYLFFIGCELSSLSYLTSSPPPPHHNTTILLSPLHLNHLNYNQNGFSLLQLWTSIAILVHLVATKSLARPLQPPASLLSNSSIQHPPHHQPPRPPYLPTSLSRRHPHSSRLHRLSKLLLPSPLPPSHHLLFPLPGRRHSHPQDARR